MAGLPRREAHHRNNAALGPETAPSRHLRGVHKDFGRKDFRRKDLRRKDFRSP